MTNMPQSTHENLFVESFIEKSKKDRIVTLLKNKKGRVKFRYQLPHFIGFDNRFIVPIPPNNQDADKIFTLLKQNGAPEECYVISENTLFDAKTMLLSNALNKIVGSSIGSIILCIPSKLCYYEGETSNTRFILKK